MLKQVFDREQLAKILTSSDFIEWRLLSIYKDADDAITHISNYWKLKKLALSPLKKVTIKKKPVFMPSIVEDDLSIRLLDRFIRRVYKVRQSDRNRITRQIKSILKDSGEYHILRLDIKNCYENIDFSAVISRLEDDLIISPECINILKSINMDLISNHNISGLPRGLSVSSTLAELYLEDLDKRIASHPSVIYSARYVDDIIIISDKKKSLTLEDEIRKFASEINLNINNRPNKYYSHDANTANFEYLGYQISVQPTNDKPNMVNIKISKEKINRIKSKIAKCFNDHKKTPDFELLKRRLQYLSMLKTVKKSKNGNLLAGIANNYQYVTDNFECLKSIDGFLCNLIRSVRFSLPTQQANDIGKISFFGNAKNKKVGKFSKIRTVKIMRVLKDA